MTINRLREAEILLNHGNAPAVFWANIGVSGCVYHRWPKGYGGVRINRAKRLKELELHGESYEPVPQT